MTDPIADMLTRIRNAHLAGKKQVQVPHSNLLEQLITKIAQLGFVDTYQVKSDTKPKAILISLKYQNQQPAITHLKRISKPGRRVYVRANQIPTPLSGFGATIISTSQGLLTNQEAKAANVGGEVICELW